MATIIMPVGDTALSSDWLTVALNEEHVVTCIGESGAELLIEQRVGATSEGQAIGKVYVSSSRPDAAGARIPGPFTYRVVRAAGGVLAGFQLEPESSGSVEE